MFVEVIHILDYPIIMMARNCHCIEHREMLDHFTQSNSTCMRTYWNAEFCGE